MLDVVVLEDSLPKIFVVPVTLHSVFVEIWVVDLLCSTAFLYSRTHAEAPEAKNESFWDKIWEANSNREGNGKAPIKEIDLDKDQDPMEISSKCGLSGLGSTKFSKVSTFKELPSFIGDFGSAKNGRRAPN